MFSKLLLPLDPSKRLKAAIDYSLMLARRLKLPLVAAYIANPAKTGAGSDLQDPEKCFFPLGERELKRFAASVSDVEVEPLWLASASRSLPGAGARLRKRNRNT